MLNNTPGSQSIQEIRGQRNKLRLSHSQYQYLKDGTVPESYVEDGTKRTDKLEKQVRERLELLPLRFEILFEDVGLLSEGGSKGSIEKRSDAWIGCWLRLLDLEIGEEMTEDELIEQLTYSGPQTNSAPEQFGNEVGTLLWNLFAFEPEGVDLQEILSNLLWGVIEGVGKGFTTDIEDPKEGVTSLLEFKSEAAEEFQRRARVESEYGERFLAHVQSIDEDKADAVFKHICDLLLEEGQVPESMLSGDHEGQATGKDLSDPPRPWFVRRLGRLVEAENPRLKDWKYGGDVGGWSLQDNIDAELVGELVEEHRLIEKQRLLDQLSDDVTRIEAKVGKGPTATQILSIVAEAAKPISAEDIADELATAKDWQSGVTELARDLAGQRDPEEYPERDIWTDRPLLEETSDRWETTTYGDALFHRLATSGEGARTLDSVLLDSVMEAALDEIQS